CTTRTASTRSSSKRTEQEDKKVRSAREPFRSPATLNGCTDVVRGGTARPSEGERPAGASTRGGTAEARGDRLGERSAIARWRGRRRPGGSGRHLWGRAARSRH